jgi:hypothetical protein
MGLSSQGSESFPTMLEAPQPAALIQIKPRFGVPLQLCLAPAGSSRLNPTRTCREEKWMKGSRKAVLVIVTMSIAVSAQQAKAIDLTGAWATSAEECKNVFVRKGGANQITFAPMSELHGGGFIAEQNRLIGRTAECAIKARKDDGQIVNIIANCASDIMLSTVQFQLNVVNQDKVRRLFPGMEDMEIYYYGCQI